MSCYIFDDLGRRISKTVYKDGREETEIAYYEGNNEIALFTGEGKLKQLRIPGDTFHKDVVRPVAVEIEGVLYAPILDNQCNIIKLIHTQTHETIDYTALDSFGSNLDVLAPITPWIFSGKHYDAETGLIYFGARYYDPELREWITPDPLGTLQSENLYQYCFNDPLHYIDPDGQFVIAIPLFLGGAAIAEAAVDAASLPLPAGSATKPSSMATSSWNPIKQNRASRKMGRQRQTLRKMTK